VGVETAVRFAAEDQPVTPIVELIPEPEKSLQVEADQAQPSEGIASVEIGKDKVYSHDHGNGRRFEGTLEQARGVCIALGRMSVQESAKALEESDISEMLAAKGRAKRLAKAAAEQAETPEKPVPAKPVTAAANKSPRRESLIQVEAERPAITVVREQLATTALTHLKIEHEPTALSKPDVTIDRDFHRLFDVEEPVAQPVNEIPSVLQVGIEQDPPESLDWQRHVQASSIQANNEPLIQEFIPDSLISEARLMIDPDVHATDSQVAPSVEEVLNIELSRDFDVPAEMIYDHTALPAEVQSYVPINEQVEEPFEGLHALDLDMEFASIVDAIDHDSEDFEPTELAIDHSTESLSLSESPKPSLIRVGDFAGVLQSIAETVTEPIADPFEKTAVTVAGIVAETGPTIVETSTEAKEVSVPAIAKVIAEQMTKLDSEQQTTTSPILTEIITVLHESQDSSPDSPNIVTERVRELVDELFEALAIEADEQNVIAFVQLLLEPELQTLLYQLVFPANLEHDGTHEAKMHAVKLLSSLSDVEERLQQALGNFVLSHSLRRFRLELAA
jgi:hypothetical protein